MLSSNITTGASATAHLVFLHRAGSPPHSPIQTGRATPPERSYHNGGSLGSHSRLPPFCSLYGGSNKGTVAPPDDRNMENLDPQSRRASSCPLPVSRVANEDAVIDAPVALPRGADSVDLAPPQNISGGDCRQSVAGLEEGASPTDPFFSMSGGDRRQSVAELEEGILPIGPSYSKCELPQSHIQAVQLQSQRINKWRKSQLSNHAQSVGLSVNTIETMLQRTRSRLAQLNNPHDPTRYRLLARMQHLEQFIRLVSSNQITVHAVLGWGDGATGSPSPTLSISEYDSLIISTSTITTPFILSLGSNIQHHAETRSPASFDEGRPELPPPPLLLRNEIDGVAESTEDRSSPPPIPWGLSSLNPTTVFQELAQFGTLWIPPKESAPPLATDSSVPSSPAAGELVLPGTGNEDWQIIRYRPDRDEQPEIDG